MQKIEAENLQLYAELDTLEDIQLQDSKQRKNMKELVKLVHEHEQKAIKSLDEITAEFRDELNPSIPLVV